jgi:hypothetical protein
MAIFMELAYGLTATSLQFERLRLGRGSRSGVLQNSTSDEQPHSLLLWRV